MAPSEDSSGPVPIIGYVVRGIAVDEWLVIAACGKPDETALLLFKDGLWVFNRWDDPHSSERVDPNFDSSADLTPVLDLRNDRIKRTRTSRSTEGLLQLMVAFESGRGLLAVPNEWGDSWVVAGPDLRIWAQDLPSPGMQLSETHYRSELSDLLPRARAASS